jgi:hypothetical protein
MASIEWPMHMDHSWSFVQLLFQALSSPPHWMSSKSPGFRKFCRRRLNGNLANASQLQRTHEAITSDFWHLSASFYGFPFKWQCPVSSRVIIFSWFLLKLSNNSALLAKVILRMTLACLCSRVNCWCNLCVLLVESLIMPLENLVGMPRAGSYPIRECEKPRLSNRSAI